MKKKGSVLLWTLIATIATGCGVSNSGDSEKIIQTEGEKMEKFDAYDLDLYMKPLWEGDVMYNETVMFVGETDVAPLLYPVTEIVSVRSYDLKKEYVRGVDYAFDRATNSLYLGADTSMPYIPLSEYYPSTHTDGQSFACVVPGKPYIRFSEGSYFSSKQITVTYRHAEASKLEAPKSQKEAFAGTIEKLRSGKPTKILFYGDSITVGCNSSGFVQCEPYADSWTQMVFKSMVKKYAATHAEYINTAVGGWSSVNGLENLEERVIAYAPDAVFLAFGMNDTGLTTTAHMQNVRAMVERIRAALPDTEICLVSTMLPNAEVKGFYGSQESFVEQYLQYSETLKTTGEKKLCVANVTEMHKRILQTKRYYDMTGNNVNHVNDFMARVYAQTVFQTVCGD